MRSYLSDAYYFIRARAAARSLFCRYCKLDLFAAENPGGGYCSELCAERGYAVFAAKASFRIL